MQRMIDAALIETVDCSWASVLCAYGARFGSQQGPYHETDLAWIGNQTKPTWLIFFPGADPAHAADAAEAYSHIVGVVMDVEAGWERDAWTLGAARDFGAAMRSRGVPSVIYSHRVTCDALAPFYDGLWVAGEPQPSTVGEREAVQWNYAGSWDESAASDWYANPHAGTPAGDDDVNDQLVSAVVKLAYEVASLKRAAGVDPDAFRQDQLDPKGFGDQVAAVMSGTQTIHDVVNNITQAP